MSVDEALNAWQIWEWAIRKSAPYGKIEGRVLSVIARKADRRTLQCVVSQLFIADEVYDRPRETMTDAEKKWMADKVRAAVKVLRDDGLLVVEERAGWIPYLRVWLNRYTLQIEDHAPVLPGGSEGVDDQQIGVYPLRAGSGEPPIQTIADPGPGVHNSQKYSARSIQPEDQAGRSTGPEPGASPLDPQLGRRHDRARLTVSGDGRREEKVEPEQVRIARSEVERCQKNLERAMLHPWHWKMSEAERTLNALLARQRDPAKYVNPDEIEKAEQELEGCQESLSLMERQILTHRQNLEDAQMHLATVLQTAGEVTDQANDQSVVANGASS